EIRNASATSSSASIRPVKVVDAPASRCSTVAVLTGRGCGAAVSVCGEHAESATSNINTAKATCTARPLTFACSMHVGMARLFTFGWTDQQQHTAPTNGIFEGVQIGKLWQRLT